MKLKKGQARHSEAVSNLIPGIFSWFGYDLPISERFQKVKAASFKRVSIWLGEEEELAKSNRLHDFTFYATEADVDIECAHASFRGCNAIWNGSEHEKQKLFDDYKKQIDFCGLSKIPILVMHIVGGDTPPAPNEDGLFLIRELVKLASSSNVSIALENTRKTDALYYLLYKIDSPFLGLCYDSSHDFLYADRPTKILHDWGSRLIYTHFSDNDGKTDSHWLPGTGVIDWDLIQEAFPGNAHIARSSPPESRFRTD
jgi:sugar phosphate isomerase/epimerase